MAQLTSYLEEGREARKLWQEEKEQLKVQNVKLLHRDSQYQAIMRKREREYEKLQNLLSLSQGKGSKGSVRSIDVSPKPLSSSTPSAHKGEWPRPLVMEVMGWGGDRWEDPTRRTGVSKGTGCFLSLAPAVDLCTMW